MSIVFDSPIRTNHNNLPKVLALGKPSLLVFEVDDCSPCKTLEPHLKAAAGKFAGQALVVRVEGADYLELVQEYKLNRFPTLLYWRDAQEVARIEGAISLQVLESHMDYLLGKVARPAPASGPSQVLTAAVSGATRVTSPSNHAPNNGGTDRVSPTGAHPIGIRGINIQTISVSPTGAHPIPVTDASFESDVLHSPLPVLVDFWAPWCGPCRVVAPLLEEFTSTYRDRLRIAKVNTDQSSQRAMSLGVQGIPTLIIFKNGREIDRLVGAAPKPQLQQFIERNL